MTPVEPGRNATGTNTVDNTDAMPTSAPVISCIERCVAATGDNPSSLMSRPTCSTTTMASSTTSPMANTAANNVSTLIENPAVQTTAKVPSSTTGTAMVGISVARR